MLMLARQKQEDGSNDNVSGLTETLVHSIFSHIESIHHLCTLLFDQLSARVLEWQPSSSIADIFLDMGPFFKSYKQFSENYTTATETLKQVKQNSPALAVWLRTREKEARCRSLDLGSLLIAPIQRVPRYILLLNAMAKVTESSHPDYRRCQAAATLLKSIVQVINDGIQEDVNRKRLMQLQSLIETYNRYLPQLPIENLVEPHRKLIKEGRLQKQSMRDRSIQTRLVYLCNDYLITITPLPLPIQTDLGKVDKMIPLATASIIIDSESDTSFYLISPIKSHLFICDTATTRSHWILEIQNTISNLVDSNPMFKEQRNQWTIEHQNGKWICVPKDKGVAPDTSANTSRLKKVSPTSPIPSPRRNDNVYVHEPMVKTNTYYNNNATTTQMENFVATRKSPNAAIDVHAQQQHLGIPDDKEWVVGVKVNKISAQSLSGYLRPPSGGNINQQQSATTLPTSPDISNNDDNNRSDNNNNKETSSSIDQCTVDDIKVTSMPMEKLNLDNLPNYDDVDSDNDDYNDQDANGNRGDDVDLSSSLSSLLPSRRRNVVHLQKNDKLQLLKDLSGSSNVLESLM
ncbi:hypothetical protein SAMD00019534_123550 [Acytostelium subglobosum LB1]|uniref:hypothetical protein n=1 Tax=Acytostelium subglobosum LB1 TaxID=1410327 RepID=UPI000644A38E|nr:hypothetical protein SAMD00019534_123550 [Acytostelium subglobosum LB1]GAM29179.1 hypothetical protein SAMD00019534_123550 [Acytostelium subglobosum LB1]|eukprot:XP_012747870.1 hypothetical protein SAMD00019534_123550 [Acytostelium subglobosum LB1]